MPQYPYRIKIEYTHEDNTRHNTIEVNGAHKFQIPRAADPAHRIVDLQCTGPFPPDDTPISHITLKLRP